MRARSAEFWRLLRRCELHHLPNRHPYPGRLSPFICRRHDSQWEFGIDWGRYRLRQHFAGLNLGFWPDRFRQRRKALITLADPDGLALFQPGLQMVRESLDRKRRLAATLSLFQSPRSSPSPPP